MKSTSYLHFSDNYFFKKMLPAKKAKARRSLLIVYIIQLLITCTGFYMMNYISLTFFLIYFLLQIVIFLLMWLMFHNRMLRNVFAVWMEVFFQGMEKNPASIVFTDENGNIEYANLKFKELSGYSFDEVYLQNPRVLKSGKMSQLEYEELWKTISSGKNWSGEFHNKKKDNNLYWVFASISPIYNKKNKIISYLGIQEDISERKKLMAQLEEKSSTDFLTGLLNRRIFFERMKIEIERSKRRGNAFSLLMIDIDFFKRVNDTYGHLAGDLVLKQLSSNFTTSLRTEDICTRFGGEEFIIVLPETELIDGVRLAERLRKFAKENPFQFEKNSISYTLSIGVALWDKIETLESTIRRADTLLYKAKKSGRDKVIFQE